MSKKSKKSKNKQISVVVEPVCVEITNFFKLPSIACKKVLDILDSFWKKYPFIFNGYKKYNLCDYRNVAAYVADRGYNEFKFNFKLLYSVDDRLKYIVAHEVGHYLNRINSFQETERAYEYFGVGKLSEYQYQFVDSDFVKKIIPYNDYIDNLVNSIIGVDFIKSLYKEDVYKRFSDKITTNIKLLAVEHAAWVIGIYLCDKELLKSNMELFNLVDDYVNNFPKRRDAK